MRYQEFVELVGKYGVDPIDRPVAPDSLGLPDATRCRLLAEVGGLLRVYHAEIPNFPPSVPSVRSKLGGTGYDELVLVTRDGEEFLAMRVDAQGAEAHKTISAAETVGLLKNAGLENDADPVAVSDRILDLLTLEEEPKAYNNRGLFSDDYLEHRIPEGEEWAADVSAAYESLRELYADKKDRLAGLDEANTEMEFVEPVLALLGFEMIKQPKVKTGSKPDYALFGSSEDKNAASKLEKGSEGFYARTLAIVEGKYWGRNLDVYTKKEDKRESEKQTSSPEMQLVRYLRETEMSWGLLTNGAEWRLYHGDALGKTKRYYSVDFETALQSEDDFRRFFLFFRREAFAPKGPESKSFLDGVLEGSERYAIRVGNNLKDVVFTRVFPQLARGFLENHTGEKDLPVDEEVLGKVYRGTLALLYRLLFLLYAESRDLLPTGDPLGYGARGINAIKNQVAERVNKGYTYTEGYVIWQSLADLFRIVDEGNRALKVPPYNGGLFKDEGNHELLRTHRISDRHLAPALDALSRQSDDNGKNRFVDYGFVGVRELGSVYEGLLEFSLKIADEDLVAIKEKGKEVYVKAGTQGRKKVAGRVNEGGLYLVNDKKERKATGSYYTPRYIVDYIVENTLGQLVEERRVALEAKLKEVGRTDDSLKRSRKSEEYRAERRREAGALEALLDVKVLDPAMGSGHFLVAAVDYLTDEFSRLISELDARPILEQLAHLREEIEESLEKYGTEADEKQLSDANLLKRMILKRCVYGVDQNEMAVELAKLSLWLDAFTVGAPLSFLDHHLKHGNSLIGSSVRDVRREVESSGTLLGSQFTGLLIQGTELMQQVGEIPDATEDEVRQSISNFRRADEVLEPYKRVMNVWTSQHFGNAGAQSFLKDELSSGGVDSIIKADHDAFAKQGREVLTRAEALSEDKRFFHWELEFPEVFYEGARERENPGFDAIVGNPPYGASLQGKENTYVLTEYKLQNYQFDTYALFVERELALTRATGMFGTIIPNTWLLNLQSTKMRRHIFDALQVNQIIHYQYPVFPQVTVDTEVTLIKKQRSKEGHDIKLRIIEKVGTAVERSVPQAKWRAASGHPVNIFERQEFGELVDKLKGTVLLENVCLITQGAKPFQVGKGTPPQTRDVVDKKPYVSERKKNSTFQPLLRGSLIRKYLSLWKDDYWISFGDWLAEPRYSARHDAPAKIVIRQTGDSLVATLDCHQFIVRDNLYTIVPREQNLNLAYVLGLLNSRLLNWFYQEVLNPERGEALAQVKRGHLARLPIRTIDSSNAKEAEYCSQMVESVETMLATNKQSAEIQHEWREWVETTVPKASKLTKEFRERGWVGVGLQDGWNGVKTVFQGRGATPTARALQELRRETEDALAKLKPLYERIEATEHQIDQIVYRLYGLTEDEISMVEGSVKGS